MCVSVFKNESCITMDTICNDVGGRPVSDLLCVTELAARLWICEISAQLVVEVRGWLTAGML